MIEDDHHGDRISKLESDNRILDYRVTQVEVSRKEEKSTRWKIYLAVGAAILAQLLDAFSRIWSGGGLGK
jgi:hypothetical protein